MSYTALYRKFRPATFDEVKGQDHIVETLKNQIKAQRIGHAYLFCGTRGTGKTSVAKIFAKAVNCEDPKDGSPCGVCPMCQSIQAQNSLNVIEIDAASNNGVDNIRQIREEVAYSPTEGKYKVYIIDEVHMLSTGAFNALLKTLEEPPSYVIFILATTEVHKIPITILSRCQRYDFRRLTQDTITDRLAELMKTEGQEVEEKALRYIARAADGAMRDALSLLDQCIAFYLGQTLTYENVLEVLGAVDTQIFADLLDLVLAKDARGLMQMVENLVVQGRELGQFVIDFTWYLRNLLLVQGADQMEDILDMSAEQIVRLKEQAQHVDADTLMYYIRIFSDLSNQLKYATQKRVLVEVACIKLCKPQMDQGYDALMARMQALEQQMEQQTVLTPQLLDKIKQEVAGGEVLPQADVQEKKAKRVLPDAIPEDIKDIAGRWRQVVNAAGGLTKACLAKAHPSLGEGNRLIIVFADEVSANYYREEEHKKEIESLIEQISGKHVEIGIQAGGEGRAATDVYPDIRSLVGMDIEIEE